MVQRKTAILKCRTELLREVDHVAILGVNDRATRFVLFSVYIRHRHPAAHFVFLVQVDLNIVAELFAEVIGTRRTPDAASDNGWKTR